MSEKQENDLRCEEKCAYNWVDCEESRNDDPICRTLKNNCLEECTW